MRIMGGFARLSRAANVGARAGLKPAPTGGVRFARLGCGATGFSRTALRVWGSNQRVGVCTVRFRHGGGFPTPEASL